MDDPSHRSLCEMISRSMAKSYDIKAEPMPLIVDEGVAQANSRKTGILAAVFMTRSLEIWRRNRLDAESVHIILAVIAITSEKFVRRNLRPEHRSLATYLPLEELQSCNVASIAAATGINRETVRRRVQGLVQSGSLIKSDSGDIALPPSKVQDPSAAELIRRQLEALARFANDCLRDGVLRIED